MMGRLLSLCRDSCSVPRIVGCRFSPVECRFEPVFPRLGLELWTSTRSGCVRGKQARITWKKDYRKVGSPRASALGNSHLFSLLFSYISHSQCTARKIPSRPSPRFSTRSAGSRPPVRLPAPSTSPSVIVSRRSLPIPSPEPYVRIMWIALNRIYRLEHRLL